MKRVFLKDIAKKLDVSIATVSLALNGNIKLGRISDELIAKIKQTALEMDYQPNVIARSLRSGKSNIIGLIVADISNPFFGTLAFFVQEYAAQKGYSVIIGNSNEQTSKLQNSIKSLKSQPVDGLIIVPTENCEEFLAPYINKKFPIVLVDRYLPSLEVSHVVIDNQDAAYKATRILIDKGCTRVALLIYKNNQTHMIERKEGYRKALTEAGCFNPNLIKEINYLDIKNDVSLAIRELISSPSSIDGIFFASNSLSTHGFSALYKRNKSFSSDFCISCFDKHDALDILPLNIPYVHQPIEEIGRQSVDLILNLIEGHNDIKKIKLSSKIVID
ncbi:MAG: LacI family DNA-binding transcriptional regulator [Bacteroidales bacterium]|nr:LacI family DNA-binding transcriptional regulator [Bacteroidales bacterium]